MTKFSFLVLLEVKQLHLLQLFNNHNNQRLRFVMTSPSTLFSCPKSTFLYQCPLFPYSLLQILPHFVSLLSHLFTFFTFKILKAILLSQKYNTCLYHFTNFNFTFTSCHVWFQITHFMEINPYSL